MTIASALVRASTVLTHRLSPPERTLTRCVAISRTQSADPYARSDHVSGWSKLAVSISTARMSGSDDGPRFGECAYRPSAPIAATCMAFTSPP